MNGNKNIVITNNPHYLILLSQIKKKHIYKGA